MGGRGGSEKRIRMHFDSSYCYGIVFACMCIRTVCLGDRTGWREEREGGRESWPTFSAALNEASHCARPGGSLLVLLFALLICMLMYLFYGSTVLIHFKINYPSGTSVPRPGSNVY